MEVWNTQRARCAQRTAPAWLAGMLWLLGACLTFGAAPAQAFHFPWDQGHDTANPSNPPPPPGPCDDGRCDRCSATASPVYAPTGHFVWTDTDVAFPGRPELALQRTHNSHDPRDGLFGNGWSAGCDVHMRLVSAAVDSGGTVPETEQRYVLVAGDGKRYVYTAHETEEGRFVAPEGRFDHIAVQDDGSAHLVAPDGSYRRFAPNGRQLARVDRNGNTVAYQYDDGGHLTRIQDDHGRYLELFHNSAGRVATVTDHSGRSWHYDYDAAGNLIRVTDPAGGERTYTYRAYTPEGDGHTYHQLTRVTDASGVVETQVRYDGERVASYSEGENVYSYSYDTDDREVTKTDALGNTTVFRYSEAGQITVITDPLGNTRNRGYNDDGRVTSITDALGHTVERSYDDQGRRLSRTNPLDETTSFEYEAHHSIPVTITSPSGRESQITLDANGNPLRFTDPAGETTELVYNAQGDLTRQTDAEGNATAITRTADGQIATVTDALGRTTTYSYDARGNRTQITNAEGETTQISYDALDRVTAITDPLGHTTQLGYDAAGRLTAVTDAEGNTTTYSYDPYGRLASRTWPSGRQISYSYRDDNRPSEITLEDGTVVTRSYDDAGRLTQEDVGGLTTTYQYNARGDLTQASNETGTVQLQYDAAGRLTQETVNGEAVASVYNADGERIQLSALGSTTAITRDDRGLATAIDGPAGSFDLGYDAVGRQTSLTRPNGTDTSYSFDAAGQLTQIQHSNGFNATYAYGFDQVGRITDWDGDGPDWDYQYDAAGRLIQATHGTDSYAYAYDAVGNRTSDGGQYNADNQLLENNQYSFSYDQRGNLVAKEDKASGARVEYQWNTRGQLVAVEYYEDGSASNPVRTLSYAYGPLGRRWQKTDNGATERYVYDRQDRIATLDGDGNLQTQVSFGPGIDNPLGSTGALNAYFHANHQGSVMALTDSSGSEQTQYGYTPYGITSVSSPVGNDFRYTAREYEAENLNYHRARYYDPTLGRWLSEDPIGFRGGVSLYGYVAGVPSIFSDPLGLAPSWVGPTSAVAGATGGTLLAVGIGSGNPVASGIGLGLVAIAGGLQIWDTATTPVEQIEQIRQSEDMREVEDNMRNLQDLIDDEYGRKEEDGEYCP